MSTFIDQTGRTITLEKTPARIISLVPSQTELLFYLGLDKEVIGITRFCVHPEQWFRTKTRIGGTKQLKTDLIHQLHPDLIIANKEENIKEQVEELATRYPVWVSDINNLKDAYEMIHSIANMVGKTVEGTELNAKIQFEGDMRSYNFVIGITPDLEGTLHDSWWRHFHSFHAGSSRFGEYFCK